VAKQLLPPGAKYLPLNQILAPGGNGRNDGSAGNGGNQIRDISSDYWFSALQPVRTSGPADLRPRQWQYQPGANIIWTPGAEDTFGAGFWVLREVADSWDLLRIVLETVKDRLCQRTMEFRLRPQPGEGKKDLKARTLDDPRIEQLNRFFAYPDGQHTWREWLRMLLEDILVLDAGSIYLERDLKGKVAALRVIDGGTICRLITDQGFTPQAPDEGYQQILYGLPAVPLTTDDLVYVMRNPRPHKRYGFGPVEQMLVTISIGLRKQRFDLDLYTQGNIPEALCFLPPDLPLDQVKEVQDWYDSILSGDLGNRRKLHFLPGYGSPKDQAFRPNIVFTKESVMKTPWDEWQLRIICNGLGVSPTLMVAPLNRATAQQNAEQAEEEGLLPKSRTIEDVINYIVKKVFGFDDIDAGFAEQREVDAEKQMTIDTGYVKVGGRTLNEMREDMGEDPYDTTKYPEADEPLVYTQQGVMTLRNALDAGAAASQKAVNDANAPPDDGGGSTSPPKNGKPNGSPKPSNGSNGKKPETLPAKKALQDLLEEHGFVKREAPRLDPTYRTPKLDQAKVAIQSAVSRVFMRQKERAMQVAGELKKKLLTTKVRKENPYHDPSTGEFSSGEGGFSERAQRAIKTYKPATKAKQDLGDEMQKKVAEAMGGSPTADNLPFDVVKGKVGVEVKTLVDAGNDKITMHPESLERKIKFAKSNKLSKTYTVAVDAREHPPVIYFRQGLGSFRINSMNKVSSWSVLSEKLV